MMQLIRSGRRQSGLGRPALKIKLQETQGRPRLPDDKRMRRRKV